MVCEKKDHVLIGTLSELVANAMDAKFIFSHLLKTALAKCFFFCYSINFPDVAIIVWRIDAFYSRVLLIVAVVFFVCFTNSLKKRLLLSHYFMFSRLLCDHVEHVWVPTTHSSQS